MATAGRPIYNSIFRKNYTMLGVVFAGAFGFELLYNVGMNRIWDGMNRGRQWKDIRSKYAQEEAKEDDE